MKIVFLYKRWLTHYATKKLENLDKNNEGNNLHDYKLILLLFFTYIEVISRG